MPRFQYQGSAEPLDTPVSANPTNNAVFGDGGIIGSCKLLQYAALVAPVAIAIAAAAAPDWFAPVFPDRLTRVLQKQATVYAAPILVPDVTNPVTPNSWSPEYPDRHVYRRVVEFPQAEAPDFVPDVTNPVTTLSWKSSTPDRLDRQVTPPSTPFHFWHSETPADAEVVDDEVTIFDGSILLAPKVIHATGYAGPVFVPAQQAYTQSFVSYQDFVPRAKPRLEGGVFAPNFVPDVTQAVTPLSWKPEYKDRHTYRRPAEFPSFFTYFDVGTQFVDLSWKPNYPSRHAYRKPVEFPSWFGPFHVPDVTDPVTALSWNPVYPDRATKKTIPVAQQAAWFFDRFDPPAAAGFDPQYFPHPVYPDRIFRKFKYAPYEPLHRVFIVITVTPVMSWDGYTNLYPARVPGKKRPAQFQPFFWSGRTPDVVIPDLSWKPSYPDTVTKKHILTAQQQAWTADRFDAPEAPPELRPGPASDSGVLFPPVPIHATWLSGVVWTLEPPPFDPTTMTRPPYPDRLDRIYPRAVYVQYQPHFGVTVSIPVMSWEGYTDLYPSWFPPKHRVLAPAHSVYPLDTPYDGVTLPRAYFPDRLDRKVTRQTAGTSVAPLIRTYTLSADTGIYLINGFDASLLWSGLVGGGSNTRLGFRLIVQDDEEDYFK